MITIKKLKHNEAEESNGDFVWETKQIFSARIGSLIEYDVPKFIKISSISTAELKIDGEYEVSYEEEPFSETYAPMKSIIFKSKNNKYFCEYDFANLGLLSTPLIRSIQREISDIGITVETRVGDNYILTLGNGFKLKFDSNKNLIL
jgi:hypothetical protein